MSREHKDCFVVEGKLALPYQYFAGTIGSRFLVSLRDDKKILGLRHPETGKVLVPPRQVDEKTLKPLGEDWVEVGPAGEVTNFTVVRYEEDYLPAKPPYVLAMIKLDGADSPLAHVLSGVDPGEVKVGMKVKAVFAEERIGSLQDIRHFVPVA